MERRKFIRTGTLSATALCCGCSALNMLKKEDKMLLKLDDTFAACGLDCTECNIYQAARDPEKAEKLAEEFRNWRFPEAKAEWFQCEGCRGDRSKHWSEQCEILRCCYDERGHQTCAQCEDFPCDRLEKWAAGSDCYRIASDRLKETATRLEN